MQSVEPIVSPPGIRISTLDDPRLFINRDMSFVEFERRVLEEAMDENNPLLERVKFLSILCANLDEFDMVHVTALRRLVASGMDQRDPNPAPNVLLEKVWNKLAPLMAEAREGLRDRIIPELANAGIRLLDYVELSLAERGAVDTYFTEIVLPVLTPFGFDSSRPFAQPPNLSLNLAVLVRDDKGVEQFAHMEVPQSIPQFVPVAARRASAGRSLTAQQCYVLLEQVICANLKAVFQDVEILQVHPFRVTRDAGIDVLDGDAVDVLDRVEQQVHKRHFGPVNRLGISQEMPEHMAGVLIENLKADRRDIYWARNPLGLNRFAELFRIERPDLHYSPLHPRLPGALVGRKDLFAAIRDHDILLHHPYESFQPVLDFIRQAGSDPEVLAVKMTLYRVGRESHIIKALIDARNNGRKVTVVVELTARFDEESNVRWARTLKEAGVHVVYGMAGLKVHGKLALVVRREGSRIRRYVHIATGNCNSVVAKIYTDLGLLSCDEDLGSDVADVFNYLTGYSKPAGFRNLLVGPITLRKGIRTLIRREIKCGDSGRLIFKMNALLDEEMIRLLYEASQAGVKVDLIVRGVCALRPGIPGISENIRVRSIVGRFLEHSRIYFFGNGGKEEVYIGSADLMPRNLDRRVEVLCPIKDGLLKLRLRDEILGGLLADNVKARLLKVDGTYVRATRDLTEPAISSQEVLLG